MLATSVAAVVQKTMIAITVKWICLARRVWTKIKVGTDAVDPSFVVKLAARTVIVQMRKAVQSVLPMFVHQQ